MGGIQIEGRFRLVTLENRAMGQLFKGKPLEENSFTYLVLNILENKQLILNELRDCHSAWSYLY